LSREEAAVFWLRKLLGAESKMKGFSSTAKEDDAVGIAGIAWPFLVVVAAEKEEKKGGKEEEEDRRKRGGSR
jgi:hypothetical protein